MKHEFKPGDKAMIEVEILEIDDTSMPYLVATPCGRAWIRSSLIHPIPTPPRPLRVDELEEGKEYSFNHCGKQQGEFIAIFDGKAVMGVRHPDIPSDFTNRSVLLIDESANIRPVEREVSGEEIMKVFNAKMFDSSMADAVIATVRHFMKGGDDGH